MKKILVLNLFSVPAVCLLLAGCDVDGEIDALSRQQYTDTCARLGIPAGSPDFNTCLLQQQQLEAEQIQNAIKPR